MGTPGVGFVSPQEWQDCLRRCQARIAVTNSNVHQGVFRHEEKEPDWNGTGDYRQFAARHESPPRHQRIVTQ
jgi:hypothetical protein